MSSIVPIPTLANILRTLPLKFVAPIRATLLQDTFALLLHSITLVLYGHSRVPDLSSKPSQWIHFSSIYDNDDDDAASLLWPLMNRQEMSVTVRWAGIGK